MNTPSWSARCRLALAFVCSLLAAAPPALAEARVIFKSERSLVLRVRDLNGDGVRDLAYFFPDQRTQFDGPGRAEIQTQDGIILAQFRASGQHEVFALGANHPADIDDNQILNSDDLALLIQRAAQEGPAGIPGDVNFDGVVNDADASRLMTSLTNLGGLGWIRFEHRWPAAFAPNPDERGVCDFFEETPEFVFCRNPGGGNNPDQSDPDDTGPLGPGAQGGGGGPDGPDDPGPGGDECDGVAVDLTPDAPMSFVSVVDNQPTPLTISASGSPPGGAATWSVVGAVLIQSDDQQCDVEVHEAGLVVVTATYIAPNGCTAEATLELPAYALDLSVDIDENGTIDEVDIEVEAQAPGLILLANNFDEDGDGVEGFADGFDWNPLIEQDDNDDTTTFIPIKLSVGGVESGSARIRIDYPASDPMALSIGDEGWELPPGNLRLWKSDGSEPRSAELLIDGGDYIAPGEYTLADLGLFGSSEVTLYVESVRESQAEGDIVIAAAVKADEESDWVAGDVVAGTGVRVVFAGRNLLDASFLEPVALVATHLAPLGSTSIAGTTTGPWREFKIHIYDPRETLAATQIGDVWLSLHHDAATQRWASDPFWIWLPGSSDNTAGAPTSTPVPILQWPPLLRWQYALAGGGERDDAIFKEIKVEVLDHMAPEQRAIAETTRDVIAEMRAEGWVSRNTADDGDYGKEVHRRVAQRLAGRPNTYWSVWLNPNTREIVSIGTQPSPNAGMRELDVVCTEPGYTPQVGQQLDRTRVLSAAEIKTSITGYVDPKHRRFYDTAVGSNKWYVQNPVCRYTGGGWVNVEKGVRTLQVAAVVGMASSAFACANPAQYDELRDNMLHEWEQAQRPDLDDVERTARFAVFALAFRAYMINFTPDETAVNVLTYGAIMRHLGYEPHPDFEE